MSLKQDVANTIKSIESPEPIYIKLNSPGDISYQLNTDVDRSEFTLEGLALKYSNIIFNRDTLEFEINPSEYIQQNINDYIYYSILNWISNTLPSPNPKLTNIYRWYANQKEITDGMYVLWKYMCSHAQGGFHGRSYTHATDIHECNIFNLLEYIRLKGE